MCGKVAYYIQPTLHFRDLQQSYGYWISVIYKGYIVLFIAENNRSKLSGTHLRGAGYEYISERHVGIF